MNIYDFDGTIYNGDSTIDFFIFCVKKNKTLLKHLPYQVSYFLLYKMKLSSKKKFKQSFFVFLKDIEVDEYVNEFWLSHYKKIKDWYYSQKKDTDIIISASPYFLLYPIQNKLGISKVISTIVDSKSGKFLGENCFGEEKIVRLKNEVEEIIIENFYSDSYSDLPLAKLAVNSYFVKGNKIIKWKL